MTPNGQKHLRIQMKTIIFDHYDPIFIISFRSQSKFGCDTNAINEGASMSLLHFFMKKNAAAVLNSRIAVRARSSNKPEKKEPFQRTTMYWAPSWKRTLPMILSLRPMLISRNLLSHRTRLGSSKLIYSEWMPFVAMGYMTNTLPSKSLSKVSNTPSARAGIHSGPRNSM